MGLNRKGVTHVNRSSRTPAGNRWKHEHLRLIWTLFPRSFVIVLLLMVLSVGVAAAQAAQQPVAKKTAVKKQTAVSATATKKTATKKTATKKTATKKTATKKTATKKTATKKSVAQLASNAKSSATKKTKPTAVPVKKIASSKSVPSKKVAKATAVPAKKVAAITLPKGKPDKKDIRKVLTGVTIYAYAPTPVRKKSKSKKPAIGRYTATGSIATAGKTIAVDPKQIPLGWWVYVEGMGYRKAEDIGGAIKGKKIDVFVSSYQDAIRFGVKKNRTIYVIGPNLPKATATKKPVATAKPKTPVAKTAMVQPVAIVQMPLEVAAQPKLEEATVQIAQTVQPVDEAVTSSGEVLQIANESRVPTVEAPQATNENLQSNVSAKPVSSTIAG